MLSEPCFFNSLLVNGTPVSTVGFQDKRCGTGTTVAPGRSTLLAGSPFRDGLNAMGSEDKVHGSACRPGYERVSWQLQKLEGGGWCGRDRWETDDPSDCRVHVHYGAAAFQGVKCNTYIYERRVGQVLPAPSCSCK